MDNKTIESYNRLASIAEETLQMLEQLDTYRKTGDKRHLFATRSHETTIKKLLKQQLDFENQNQQKEAA